MSESKNNGFGTLLLGVAFGLACGYSAGILTAQKPGRELRRDIGDYSTDLAQRITERFQSLKEVIKEKATEIKSFSDENLKKTAKNIEELVESLDKQLEALTKKQPVSASKSNNN